MNYTPMMRRLQALFLAGLMALPSFVATAGMTEQITGELWISGAATIDGKAAVTGFTVLSGNHIQTGREGIAIINLGKLGRVKLDPETDMILNFNETSISGNVTTGDAMINAAEGITVNLKTPCGTAESEKQLLSSTALEKATQPKENATPQAIGANERTAKRCPRIATAPIGAAIGGGLALPGLLTGGVLLSTIATIAIVASTTQSGITLSALNLTRITP